MLQISRRAFMVSTGVSILGATAANATMMDLTHASEPLPKQSKPNVIFILCDDLGFGDVGRIFQNQRQAAAKLKTPEIDKMIDAGCWLTDHYTAAPVCAPARASLLTGKHQGHATLRDNQFDRPFENTFTLGHVMQAAGYGTYAVGKWGLGGGGESNMPMTGDPLNSGFDHAFYYPFHMDGHTYYHHAHYKPIYEDKTIAPDSEVALRYDTDLFTARTEKYIQDHVSQTPKKPFFIYLAYTTIHGSYCQQGIGFDEHASFQIPGDAFTPIQGTWPLAPTTRAKANRWVHPDHRADKGFVTPAMRRYATSLRRLDDNLGDLMQFLKAKGLADNTVIIFTSDNGPAKEQGSDPALFTSAGPFRGYKRWVTEGGVREPTFAIWPGHIPAGRVDTTPSQFQCWMPTLADIGGLPPPAHSDGVTLLPSLTGRGKQSTVAIYGEYRSSGFGFEHQQFMRINDTVILRQKVQSAATPIEVYDVKKDPMEEHNLANTLPAEKLQAYKDELLRHRLPVALMSQSVGTRGFQDAPRTYDNEAIPGLAQQPNCPTKTTYFAPINYCPYLPDLRCLTPSTEAPQPEGLVMQTGVYQQATEGDVTIQVAHPKAFYLWIHHCRIFSYEEGGTHKITVRLGAGAHPYRAYWQRHNGTDAQFSFA